MNAVNLAITSDFPSTLSQAVVARIQTVGDPRVAWISPTATAGRERFPAAQSLFRSIGVPRLEYRDLDQEPHDGQLARLDACDIVYLTGGDPIVFCENIRRRGLGEWLRGFAASGRLIVGASAGAMQLTRNVSLFRLLAATVDEVVDTHAHYEGLGMVPYEVLPHLNRHDATFLARVQRYSALVRHDVVALDDGAALIYDHSDKWRCVGRAVRFRGGVETPVEVAT